MNLADYPRLASRTEKVLPSTFLRLEHASLGVVTETGEIATVVKRIAIYGKSLDDFEKDGKTTLRAHIAEEIGDVLWYLPIITSEFDANFVFEDVHLNPEDDALPITSLSRRLSVAAGNIAFHVECLFLDQPSNANPVDEARVVVHYLTVLAKRIGMDLESIAASNIEKLRERFPDAYSDEAAEARADKGGVDAINS
jgi:NTP pyrophosphatase (non-canonical NTP hydrolase)